MIKVTFVEPDNDTWRRWRNKCISRTNDMNALAAQGMPYRIASSIYADKEFKKILIQVFHEKCAYCESGIANSQGDIEHFRPKGEVKDEDGKLVMVLSANGREDKHPGYYWLAYDFTNLLPACQRCNQPNTTVKDNRPAGKRTHFPIKGVRAVSPNDDLAAEQPLLLNPTVDDPNEHLTVDGLTGIIGGKTDNGKACIKIFDLNKDQYISERKKAYRYAAAAFLDKLKYQSEGAEQQALEKQAIVESYERGSEPFSMAGRVAIALLRTLSVRT